LNINATIIVEASQKHIYTRTTNYCISMQFNFTLCNVSRQQKHARNAKLFLPSEIYFYMLKLKIDLRFNLAKNKCFDLCLY